MDFFLDKLSFFAAGPYIAVFLFFLLGDAGIPLPISGSMLLMYGGYLVREGKLHGPFLMLAAVVGLVLGAIVLYTLAKRGGSPLLARYGSWIGLGNKRCQRIEGWVKRHGIAPVALGRILPGTHTHTAAMSGVFKVPFKPFVAAILVADLMYVAGYLFLGAAINETVDRVLGPGSELRWLTFAPLAFGVATWLIVSRLRKWKAARAESQS